HIGGVAGWEAGGAAPPPGEKPAGTGVLEGKVRLGPAERWVPRPAPPPPPPPPPRGARPRGKPRAARARVWAAGGGGGEGEGGGRPPRGGGRGGRAGAEEGPRLSPRAPPATARTEATSFTRERDEPLEAAAPRTGPGQNLSRALRTSRIPG